MLNIISAIIAPQVAPLTVDFLIVAGGGGGSAAGGGAGREDRAGPVFVRRRGGDLEVHVVSNGGGPAAL